MAHRLEDLGRDVRHAARLLRRNAGFTLVAGLTLALGIGATSAIFSVLYATVIAPLPYPDYERLVWIEAATDEGAGRTLPVDMVAGIREATQTLEGISHAFTGGVNVTLTGPGGAERVFAEQVSFHTFEVLGVQPVVGRWFEPETVVQGNATPEMVISYRLWQRIFDGDPDVVGKRLPGWNAGWGETIVGVMPRGFYTHPSRADTDIWGVLENPGATIGRIKPGVGIEQAQSELEVMLRQQDTPETWHARLAPLYDVYRSGYSAPLSMLLGAVGFVLLIAAVNVANLQLNRGVTREAEMATRAALGAGRWKLLRQLLIENGVLALVGGTLGILVALAGIRVFVAVAPNFYAPSEEIAVNGPVLGFILAICLLTAILSGLIPGLRTSKPDLGASIKQGGRGVAGRGRLGVRRVLVVSEIALAMILLVGAGLMIHSYARLTHVDIGMDPDGVLRMDVNFNGMDRYRTRHASNHYSVTPEISNFYTQVLDRLRALPGVVSAASTSNLPPRTGPPLGFRILGDQRVGDEADQATFYHEVSPGYFETMRIPLTRGRAFAERDNESAPGVVIVSETLARQFFGDEDPIGRTVLVDVTEANPGLEADRAREIVGVAGDVRMGLESEFAPIMYVPYRQNLTDYPGFAYFWIHAVQDFVVRTAGDPAPVAAAAREVFVDVDPTVAVEGMMPMSESLSALAAGRQFWMQLLGIFAGLGIVLAAIGIYGVVSYSVEQRTHEFGIRTALGAQRAEILWLVLREGALLTVLGLILGIGGAFAATRQLESQLFGITRMDPITIAAVTVFLVAVALLACYLPGRRAAALDPVRALRAE